MAERHLLDLWLRMTDRHLLDLDLCLDIKIEAGRKRYLSSNWFITNRKSYFTHMMYMPKLGRSVAQNGREASPGS